MGLREDLADSFAEAEAKGTEFYRGPDWWQLSDEERFVFGIEPARWPRMMQTWWCFEHFMGVVSSGAGPTSEEATAEARLLRPDIKEAGVHLGSFTEFGVAFAELTIRECEQMYTKHHYWLARRGGITYPDEEGFSSPRS